MTENRAAASRIGYMDGLRAAAMVGVILIHVCAKAATALAADGQALGVSWQLANLLDALGRFAVPAYLMVTGGLLLGSDRALSVRETLRRRVVRIAAPLVFWTAAYLGLQAATVPGYDWKGAAAGLMPALQLPDYANLDILGGYLGYVLLGWLLATTKRAPSKGLCAAGFLAGLLVTAGGTWFMTRRAGELNGVFYQYFMPNVVLMAACAFLLFKGLWAGRESGRVIRRLSALSFGVYLVHEVFLRLLEPVFAPLPAAAGMLLLSLAVLALSLAAAWLLSLIPGVRFITLGERK